jgi:hypothetical protein
MAGGADAVSLCPGSVVCKMIVSARPIPTRAKNTSGMSTFLSLSLSFVLCTCIHARACVLGAFRTVELHLDVERYTFRDHVCVCGWVLQTCKVLVCTLSYLSVVCLPFKYPSSLCPPACLFYALHTARSPFCFRPSASSPVLVLRPLVCPF